MSITLNREAFNKLMDEDIEWLLKQDRTLERDHIKEVLEWFKKNKTLLDQLDTKRNLYYRDAKCPKCHAYLSFRRIDCDCENCGYTI